MTVHLFITHAVTTIIAFISYVYFFLIYKRMSKTLKMSNGILGNSRPRSRLPYQRIVGGEEAEPFSWPWVVRRVALFYLLNTRLSNK